MCLFWKQFSEWSNRSKVDSKDWCRRYFSEWRFTGRLVEIDDDLIKSNVEKHLLLLCDVRRFDVWIPCKFIRKKYWTILSYVNCSLNIPFLKEIVTSNEKWIPYNKTHKCLWRRWNELSLYQSSAFTQSW